MRSSIDRVNRIMSEWIEYSTDWAYWINTNAFRMAHVKKSVRLGSIVLTKKRETLDTGHSIIVTSYGIAKDSGIEDIGKRKASEVLAKQMHAFMREKEMFPFATEIKKTFKNGNVDLAYTPSDYDTFTIRFTPAMVGGNVEDFLGQLNDFEEVEEESFLGEPWKIEPAKSTMASCRTCGSSIPLGELRLGEPSTFGGRAGYNWHHLSCAVESLGCVKLESLTGYSDLTEIQRNEVRTVISLQGLLRESNRATNAGQVTETCMKYLNGPNGIPIMENLDEGESFLLQSIEHTLHVEKKDGKASVTIVWK